MTCTDYDRIADVLHAAMPEDRSLAHLRSDREDMGAWQAVRVIAAELAAVFDKDPAFEYEAWLAHVMNGRHT